MDKIVSNPTLFMGGEHNKPERVNVTPLSHTGGKGAGQGLTININNPTLSSHTIRHELIPQIKEAVRRGADLGVGR